ncbi:bifunctional 3,4-dihydroxy-2-butanone-4-phosphate synthase/GTP cyclohydrolase II [Chitinibacteraceae bacterium HSL-7]
MPISPIQDLIQDVRLGRMVILVDEEDRENEGDIVVAAEHVTPELVNFMAKHARGLICLTLTADRCRQLNLPLMVAQNGSSHGTNFTVSIEAAEGVSTGISAFDRALTVQRAIAPNAKPADLVSPGHIFPLLAQPGGVLARAGHTEAGCDLAQLAGCTPASVICEIMNDDGTMARLPELEVFAQTHGLKMGTVADLIEYRSQHESLVEIVGRRSIETFAGTFDLVVFRDKLSGATHLALVRGTPSVNDETLVRVHEPLSVMDWIDLGSAGHTWSIRQVLEAFNRSNAGVLVLLHRTESGAELLERALPQVAEGQSRRWDVRSYGIGAQMLRALGVGRMRVLSNECHLPSMAGFGLEITGFAAPNSL